MKRILQRLGRILLAYSVAGLLLHYLANLEGFGHHCEMLLFSIEKNHLVVFILTASLSAALFFTARALSATKIKTPV